MSNQGCYEDPIDLTASEVDSQPPAAKPLPSVWLPDDDPKPILCLLGGVRLLVLKGMY